MEGREWWVERRDREGGKTREAKDKEKERLVLFAHQTCLPLQTLGTLAPKGSYKIKTRLARESCPVQSMSGWFLGLISVKICLSP